MLTPLTPDQMASYHCLYAVTPADDPTAVFYIGVCKLTDVYLTPDLRHQTEWQKSEWRFRPIVVTILQTGEAARDLWKPRHELVSRHRPYCNIHGYTASTHKRGIVCITDGHRFGSQTIAAAAYGIDPAHLSRHLRNIPGHQNVKGLQFRYLDPLLDTAPTIPSGRATPPDVTGVGRDPFAPNDGGNDDD